MPEFAPVHTNEGESIIIDFSCLKDTRFYKCAAYLCSGHDAGDFPSAGTHDGLEGLDDISGPVYPVVVYKSTYICLQTQLLLGITCQSIHAVNTTITRYMYSGSKCRRFNGKHQEKNSLSCETDTVADMSLQECNMP